MRQGPGISFPVVQRLQNGVDGVTLIGKPVFDGNAIWQGVKSRGVIGWVNADYLTPSNLGGDPSSSLQFQRRIGEPGGATGARVPGLLELPKGTVVHTGAWLGGWFVQTKYGPLAPGMVPEEPSQPDGPLGEWFVQTPYGPLPPGMVPAEGAETPKKPVVPSQQLPSGEMAPAPTEGAAGGRPGPSSGGSSAR